MQQVELAKLAAAIVVPVLLSFFVWWGGQHLFHSASTRKERMTGIVMILQGLLNLGLLAILGNIYFHPF